MRKWGCLTLMLLLACIVLVPFSVIKHISPNLHYIAIAGGNFPDIRYLVIDVTTRKPVLGSHGQYDTPNDVKGGGFSSDSTKFAAIYHYGGEYYGGYTWIGVWRTDTGEFLYFRRKPGWTTSLSGVFD